MHWLKRLARNDLNGFKLLIDDLSIIFQIFVAFALRVLFLYHSLHGNTLSSWKMCEIGDRLGSPIITYLQAAGQILTPSAKHVPIRLVTVQGP